MNELKTSLYARLGRNRRRIEVIDILGVAHPCLGVTVTLKAERHTEGLAVRDNLHLVNLAMTLNAADTAIHVSRVVKIRIIGRLVDPNPRHRLAACIAVSNRSEQGAVGLDLVMAVHARLRSRNIGVARLVDVAVAKAAINS